MSSEEREYERKCWSDLQIMMPQLEEMVDTLIKQGNHVVAQRLNNSKVEMFVASTKLEYSTTNRKSLT